MANAHERNRASGGRLEGVFGELLVRRFAVREPRMYRVVEAVTAERLTSIDVAALCELAQAVMDLEYKDLDGDILEAGVGSGGAAIVIASAKRRNRALTAYDPFAAGPEARTRILNALAEHGADERNNVRVVAGPYAETISGEGTLALAHLDCPRYDPMLLLLDRLVPRLAAGGQIIIDDYHAKDECKRAVDEYFHGKSGFQLVRKSRLHVVRS